MTKIREWKTEKKILIGEKTRFGLFGYDGKSDYNRFLLFSNGQAYQHCYCGQIWVGRKIEWEGRKYSVIDKY